MSISEKTTLPGEPATLEFIVQNQLTDPKDPGCSFETIWAFENKGIKPVLIKRVQMIHHHFTGTTCLDVFFHKKWCPSMTEAFPESKKITFLHHHKVDPGLRDVCHLQVFDRKNMRTLMQLIHKTQNFKGDSKVKLEQILDLDQFA